MARKLTDTVQLKVRLSEALRRQMEDAAARNGRSMNAEIVARLQNSVQRHQDAVTELANVVLDSMSDEVRERVFQIAFSFKAGPPSKEIVDARLQRKDERKAGGKS
jgi:hypothetical protein